ncbi:hypothetical protein BDV19DRAFT_170849 [Aspergillus venezuelensis]
MTLTTYPATTYPPDLAALNVSRLIARLEHNLLSQNADLKSLRRSEDHRIRVGANIEYARANLQALERSLPQIKPVDRRHDLHSTLSRNRQILKQLQNVLDEIQAEEEMRSSSGGGEGWGFEEEDEDEDAEDDSSEDLLGTPEGGSTTDEAGAEDDASRDTPRTTTATTPSAIAPATSTVESSSSPTPTAPAPPPALRNRRNNTSTSTPSTSKATIATGTSNHPELKPDSKPQPGTGAETESALSTDRAEQEDLTSSLLDLATQLKSSSQQFQASLEAEKSVLARAAEGLDRTTGNLAAAEKRMGLLRRMTEGKGWWGRMMLYAWIFALWVVAVLIVFVGPKLRF